MNLSDELEKYRIKEGIFGSHKFSKNGCFRIPYQAFILTVMASDGRLDGWEHVSVSLRNRCPNWKEMCYIKSLFWDEEEFAIQIHPAKKDYVNNHPYCLHLWKPIDGMELPHFSTVGIKGLEFKL